MTNTCPELEAYLDKLVAFCLLHRGKMKALEGTEIEIRDRLRVDALRMSVLSYTDADENILGMVHGIPDYKKKLFHVSSIITTHSDCLPAFVQMFDHMYPNFTLAGIRYGKLVNYNTERFKKKFIKK